VSKDNLPSKTSAAEALELRLDKLPALDLTDVVERTMSRIINAASPEEAAANPESQGLRDLAGRTIVVHDILGCLPSTMKTGPSRYIVLDCTDTESGERLTTTTGSVYAVGTALRYWEMGWFPATFRVVELESASNPGQSSLWLVKA
jgi:hypothetical protein